MLDVFEYIKLYNLSESLSWFQMNLTDQDNITEGGLHLWKVPTLYNGLCYSVEIMGNTSAEIALGIAFKESFWPKVILHPKGHELSLATATWKTQPYEIADFRKHFEVGLSMKVRERRAVPGQHCIEGVTEEESYNCFKTYIGQFIHDPIRASKYCQRNNTHFGNCTIPMASIKQMSIFSCTEFKIFDNNFADLLLQQS